MFHPLHIWQSKEGDFSPKLFSIFFSVNVNYKNLLIILIKKENAKQLLAPTSQFCSFSVLYLYKN